MNKKQSYLIDAFRPWADKFMTCKLRHLILFPGDWNDGLTRPLVEDVILNKHPFMSSESGYAEAFYGDDQSVYDAFADAAVAIMDVVRHDWPDSMFKVLAGDRLYASKIWMHLLYQMAKRSSSPLLKLNIGKLVLRQRYVFLEHSTGQVHLEDDDLRWTIARRMAGDLAHEFVMSRHNVFVLTQYALDAGQPFTIAKNDRRWCERRKQPPQLFHHAIFTMHATEDDKVQIAPILSELDRAILAAMIELGASTSDDRQTADEIARRACGPKSDANSIKRRMSMLRVNGLVCTKTGGGGGSWLTPEGVLRAQGLAG